MEKRQNSRRHWALLLIMCLIICMLPVDVLADENEQATNATVVPPEEMTEHAEDAATPTSETTALAEESVTPTEETIAPTEENADGSTWIDTGTCGENLTWTLDADGTLTISGTGDMEDYGTEGNDPPWLAYSGGMDSPTSETIRRVVIEEGVTSIGEDAFWCFAFLETVEIPSTVTRIGAAAFGHCESLNNVVIPDGVTVLEYYVFGDCYALSNITIPDSVTTISEWAFSTTGLTNIVIPSSVTTIGDCAFRYSSLQGITLQEGLVSIGEYVFEYTNLGEVQIPDSVTNIGYGGFAASSLKSINFPPNYTTIRAMTFFGLSVERVVIPAWITSIENGAFACSTLKEIVFLGDAPVMEYPCEVPENGGWTITAYYPGDNDTWTQEALNSILDEQWSDIVFVPYYDYQILDGADSVVTEGDNLTVRASGAYSDFVGVSVDGETVNSDNYSVAEGSTIVTLKAAYLETLTPGSHTMTISFKHGDVSTTFTLNEVEESTTPPAKPENPTEPTVKPTEPENPTEPSVKPTEPENSTEPTAKPSEPEETKPSDPTNPNTGDWGILLPVLMMALCTVAAVILIGSKKRMI